MINFILFLSFTLLTVETIDEDNPAKDNHHAEIKLPVKSTLNIPSNTATPIKLSRLPMKESVLTQAARTSGILLNLPPLLQKKEATDDHNESLTNSDNQSTSNFSADHEDTRLRKTLDMNNPTDEANSHSSSSTSFSAATTADTDNVTDLGRYCKGFAFEEIYRGKETSFQYSGIIRGATYYFRIRCHNAAGEGPWSNTYRCNVPPESKENNLQLSFQLLYHYC